LIPLPPALGASWGCFPGAGDGPHHPHAISAPLNGPHPRRTAAPLHASHLPPGGQPLRFCRCTFFSPPTMMPQLPATAAVAAAAVTAAAAATVAAVATTYDRAHSALLLCSATPLCCSVSLVLRRSGWGWQGGGAARPAVQRTRPPCAPHGILLAPLRGHLTRPLYSLNLVWPHAPRPAQGKIQPFPSIF
jgi:hypothetical protein